MQIDETALAWWAILAGIVVNVAGWARVVIHDEFRWLSIALIFLGGAIAMAAVMSPVFLS